MRRERARDKPLIIKKIDRGRAVRMTSYEKGKVHNEIVQKGRSGWT